MKPVCVPCQRFFRMKKSGFYFFEGMPTGDGRAEPGTAEPEKWKPYKLWVGDLWECQGCGAQILSGFGARPIAEHFETTFTQHAASLSATFQVNDC